MAAALRLIATKLHLRDEKHEDFRRLCAHHLRIAADDVNQISADETAAACTSFLEDRGLDLWPGYHERRAHLLDTPGDRSWTSKLTKITGPDYMRNTRHKGKGKPTPLLKSDLGVVVMEYFAGLAAGGAALLGNDAQGAQTLLNNILANDPEDEDDLQDVFAEEVARELWLRDPEAAESLALHYLHINIPDFVGVKPSGEQLSNNKGRIEQAVVSLLDEHADAFWPNHMARSHLQAPVPLPKHWKVYLVARFEFVNFVPIYKFHGRMDDKEIQAWSARFAGMHPKRREQVACSKIGQVLKTYLTDLLRRGQEGEVLDASEVEDLVDGLTRPTTVVYRLVDGDYFEELDPKAPFIISTSLASQVSEAVWCYVCGEKCSPSQVSCGHPKFAKPAPKHSQGAASQRKRASTARPHKLGNAQQISDAGDATGPPQAAGWPTFQQEFCDSNHTMSPESRFLSASATSVQGDIWKPARKDAAIEPKAPSTHDAGLRALLPRPAASPPVEINSSLRLQAPATEIIRHAGDATAPHALQFCPAPTCKRHTRAFTKLASLKSYCKSQHGSIPRHWCDERRCWFSATGEGAMQAHRDAGAHGMDFVTLKRKRELEKEEADGSIPAVES